MPKIASRFLFTSLRCKLIYQLFFSMETCVASSLRCEKTKKLKSKIEVFSLSFFWEEIMACFTVPLAEAVVLTAVKKIAFKRNADSVINEAEMTKNQKIAVLKEKFRILEKMLYGGSFLLAVEHLYHGEISFVPPFLTAMKNPAEIPEMLREMATVGVGMALLTTVVWAAGIGISALVKNLKKKSADGIGLSGAAV